MVSSQLGCDMISKWATHGQAQRNSDERESEEVWELEVIKEALLYSISQRSELFLAPSSLSVEWLTSVTRLSPNISEAIFWKQSSRKRSNLEARRRCSCLIVTVVCSSPRN